VHLDPLLFIDADEVTALAQDPATITYTVIILDSALVAAQYSALTVFLVAKNLALALSAFDGQHECLFMWLRYPYADVRESGSAL
jgi:hypothetical protein